MYVFSLSFGGAGTKAISMARVVLAASERGGLPQDLTKVKVGSFSLG